MQASLSLVIEKFSLRIEVIHGQDADRAPLKLAEAEREPVLDADAAGLISFHPFRVIVIDRAVRQ